MHKEIGMYLPVLSPPYILLAAGYFAPPILSILSNNAEIWNQKNLVTSDLPYHHSLIHYHRDTHKQASKRGQTGSTCHSSTNITTEIKKDDGRKDD